MRACEGILVDDAARKWTHVSALSSSGGADGNGERALLVDELLRAIAQLRPHDARAAAAGRPARVRRSALLSFARVLGGGSADDDGRGGVGGGGGVRPLWYDELQHHHAAAVALSDGGGAAAAPVVVDAPLVSLLSLYGRNYFHCTMRAAPTAIAVLAAASRSELRAPPRFLTYVDVL